MDNRRSEKLTLTFSSGELKKRGRVQNVRSLPKFGIDLHLEFNFKSVLWHSGRVFVFHAGDRGSRPGWDRLMSLNQTLTAPLSNSYMYECQEFPVMTIKTGWLESQ